MDKITATTNADTVAVAIHSLGFTPTSSVVLMLLENHTVAATLRLDAHPEAPADFWAAQVTNYVDRLKGVTGVLLLSFENDRAMTPAQYRALSSVLARTGRPIHHALLIRGGYLTDYEHRNQDTVPFDMVATSNAALALMLGTEGNPKLAADIPPCTTKDAAAQVQRFTEEARPLDEQDHPTRIKVLYTLVGITTGYRDTGTVTPSQAAWLAGTCANKGLRDLVFASLAVATLDLETMSAALMGEIPPDSWEHFRNGADAIYTALEYIPPEHRTDLLAGLGWTRWIDGKGSEAMAFLDLARTTNPGHRLTKLLTRLIASGQMPDSATIKH
ncbi:hypothetical protein BLJ79_17805 [Arthrobacter sp. UCD-GKA]|uniref:DUF4192 family protein n=1 Tax=Arthrobacter sp. UCD-GKA TaxID=1913576 RepID=UPI0008DE034F|nr:DUF4192 family protein [Arthrobacter sp. UCD-GKA]OIH82805.1 hypothetical protein BLJ79_17805 [Arthrobacter sp. UCD-GKA]